MTPSKTFILDVELADICNINCKMCPREELARPKGFMNAKTFDMVIKKLNETNATHAILSGFGEPGLNPNFAEFADALASKTSCYTQINSNGLPLTYKVIDALTTTKVNAINLNINGHNQAEYEKAAPGKDNFKELLSNIDYMLEKKKKGWDISLKIQPTLLDETNEHFKTFKNFWFKRGIDEIILHPCNNRGGYYQDKSRHSGKLEKGIAPYCRHMLFVAWNGDVFSCSHDIKGKYKLGAIDALQQSWLKTAHIPLCNTCNISSFKIIKSNNLC